MARVKHETDHACDSLVTTRDSYDPNRSEFASFGGQVNADTRLPYIAEPYKNNYTKPLGKLGIKLGISHFPKPIAMQTITIYLH
jgi:hypothetical protein